jgi:hypothetical protein
MLALLVAMFVVLSVTKIPPAAVFLGMLTIRVATARGPHMTIATLSSTESRHVKALALFEQRSQWLPIRDRHGRVLVGMPSQTKPGLVHVMAPDGSSCDCYDFRKATATVANTRLPSSSA